MLRILITPLLLGATLALLLVLSACSEEAAPTLTAVKTFSSGPRVMPTPQWTEPPPPVSEPDPRRNPPTSTDIPGIADPGSDEVGLYLVPRAPLGKVQVVYDFETIPFEFTGAATPSVDSRIYDADAVVRATFVSASDGILNFRANEYLKGSGPTVFTVAADTDGRNNQWDTHEAILFLATSGEQVSSGAQRQSGGQFIFIQSWEGNSYNGNLPEGFALGARTPLWLPSESTPQNSGGRSTANANPSFIIDLASPLGDANPTVSLNELRAAIAWQQGGTGVKGYDSCVRASLGNQRFHRDFEAYYAESWPPPSYESNIEAGQGQGAIVDSFERSGTKRYHYAWLSGDDAALFRYRIVDDDALPQTGFWTNIKTERPLPAGTYLLTEHSQLGIYRPCNYIPTRHAFGWTVTVTPPPVTIEGGTARSEAVTATRSSDGPVTVSVASAVFQLQADLQPAAFGSAWGSRSSWGGDAVGGNHPATGTPAISGTAQVGQTLTADTSGISDADGLENVSYSYQWLSSRDTEIDGATSSTYTPQASDNGKTIKVRVTFTDDAGNEESLTCAATETVGLGGL